eukprot:1161601-Pelagomonas_calceolata.AAC.1
MVAALGRVKVNDRCMDHVDSHNCKLCPQHYFVAALGVLQRVQFYVMLHIRQEGFTKKVMDVMPNVWVGPS